MKLGLYREALLRYFQDNYLSANADRTRTKFKALFARWVFATPRDEETLWPVRSIVALVDLEFAALAPRPGFKKKVQTILSDCEAIFVSLDQLTPATTETKENTFFSELQSLQMRTLAQLHGTSKEIDTTMQKMANFYRVVGGVSNHFGVPRNVVMALGFEVIELFGTPFNTSSLRFCSPLFCEKEIFGSLGTAEAFLRDTLSSNHVLLVNPPFDATLMNETCELLTERLANVSDVIGVLILPAWTETALLSGLANLHASGCVRHKQFFPKQMYPFFDYFKSSFVCATNTVQILFASQSCSETHLTSLFSRFQNFVYAWRSITCPLLICPAMT